MGHVLGRMAEKRIVAVTLLIRLLRWLLHDDTPYVWGGHIIHR